MAPAVRSLQIASRRVHLNDKAAKSGNHVMMVIRTVKAQVLAIAIFPRMNAPEKVGAQNKTIRRAEILAGQIHGGSVTIRSRMLDFIMVACRTIRIGNPAVVQNAIRGKMATTDVLGTTDRQALIREALQTTAEASVLAEIRTRMTVKTRTMTDSIIVWIKTTMKMAAGRSEDRQSIARSNPVTVNTRNQMMDEVMGVNAILAGTTVPLAKVRTARAHRDRIIRVTTEGIRIVGGKAGRIIRNGSFL